VGQVGARSWLRVFDFAGILRPHRERRGVLIDSVAANVVVPWARYGAIPERGHFWFGTNRYLGSRFAMS
jgi:hypothetical protein